MDTTTKNGAKSKYNHNLRRSNSQNNNKDDPFGVQQVKKENSEESPTENTDENIDEDNDFKDYAVTAMNELLGWYGYANGGSIPKTDLKTIEYLSKLRRKGNNNLGQQQMKKKITTSTITSTSNSNSGSDSPKSSESCGWCGKCVEELTALSSGSDMFCSELCFSQSRRANFKKNKTCDWCKHVRHTISYVDFQDGVSQLQFCSDKCLNQYKMQIFCRETRAHLEMHPHLGLPNNITSNKDTSCSSLITPELWLKNCKSPRSRSTSPSLISSNPLPQQTSPLPLITVAPPSKLLASPPEVIKTTNLRNKSNNKRLRKKAPTIISQSNNNKRIDIQPQDLRVIKQQHSSTNLQQHSVLSSALPLNGNLNFQSNRFDRNNRNGTNHNEANVQTPVQSDHGLHTNYNIPNVLPPVTIMVPYPVMIPVPIPIPIPLPISSFLQAAELKAKSSQKNEEKIEKNGTNNNGANDNISSSPFTNGVNLLETNDPSNDDNEEDHDHDHDEEDAEEIIVDDVREISDEDCPVLRNNNNDKLQVMSSSNKRKRPLNTSFKETTETVVVCKNFIGKTGSSKKQPLSV